MSTWRAGQLGVAALVAVLVSGASVEDAAARMAPSRLSGVFNGRRVSCLRRTITAVYATTGVNFGGGPRPRPGRVYRTFGINCGVFNLRTVTLPFTVDCFTGYNESNPRRSDQTKMWTSGGILVTFETLDGSRVTGTFRGTLQPVLGTTLPATVENGRFSLILTDIGV